MVVFQCVHDLMSWRDMVRWEGGHDSPVWGNSMLRVVVEWSLNQPKPPAFGVETKSVYLRWTSCTYQVLTFWTLYRTVHVLFDRTSRPFPSYIWKRTVNLNYIISDPVWQCSFSHHVLTVSSFHSLLLPHWDRSSWDRSSPNRLSRSNSLFKTSSYYWRVFHLDWLFLKIRQLRDRSI